MLFKYLFLSFIYCLVCWKPSEAKEQTKLEKVRLFVWENICPEYISFAKENFKDTKITTINICTNLIIASEQYMSREHNSKLKKEQYLQNIEWSRTVSENEYFLQLAQTISNILICNNNINNYNNFCDTKKYHPTLLFDAKHIILLYGTDYALKTVETLMYVYNTRQK